jgi:deazaflavin-dependent oxidoreductase (nitroreductase family)
LSRPSPFLRVVFKLPDWFYRVGLGWLLGKRILSVTHRGRKSGRLHDTVLEVAMYDADRTESIVASAYGTRADWYRNIQAEPALRVRTGRMDYVPEQRFLSPEEARKAAADFCRLHPWEAKLAPRVLPAIGAAVDPNVSDPAGMLAQLPMVAFRPRD